MTPYGPLQKLPESWLCLSYNSTHYDPSSPSSFLNSDWSLANAHLYLSPTLYDPYAELDNNQITQ